MVDDMIQFRTISNFYLISCRVIYDRPQVAAPLMALKVIDDAIQLHGAHGVSQDSKLADMYTNIRTLRVADGCVWHDWRLMWFSTLLVPFFMSV